MAEFDLRVGDGAQPRPRIAPLPTGRAAFIGRTLRGPVDRPTLVRSFAEFQQEFGGLWQPSTLAYAVEQFFDSGGREALVVRVANGARGATLALPSGRDARLLLRAVRPGTREFLRACVDYDNLPAGDPDSFNLTIQRVRTQGSMHVEDQEIHRALSVSPGSARNVAAILAGSALVRIAGTVPAARPDRTIDEASGLATGYVHSSADGDDGAELCDYDLIGSPQSRSGLFALGDEHYFNFLCIPPLSRERDLGSAALLVAARFCRDRRATLLLDPPAAWGSAEEAIAGVSTWEFSSDAAAMYFPRLLAYDRLRGRFERFAPCGAVAGMLARRDAQAPVWQEEAGGAEPVLRPGHKSACAVSDAERHRLWASGINVLQSVRAPTRHPLRARTLAPGGAADGRDLAQLRTTQFVLNSIERGTRWAAAADAPADAARRVEAEVREFLGDLHRAGAFADRSVEDAFFVICDARVNADGAARDRRFDLLIGLAAARIGEFRTWRIAHTADRSGVRTVTLNRLHDLRFSPEELEWADRLAHRLQSGSRA